jgi:hypothetical protein
MDLVPKTHLCSRDSRGCSSSFLWAIRYGRSESTPLSGERAHERLEVRLLTLPASPAGRERQRERSSHNDCCE